MALEVFGYCPDCGLEWHSFGVTFGRRQHTGLQSYLSANPHVLGVKCQCGFKLSREKGMSGKWG